MKFKVFIFSAILALLCCSCEKGITEVESHPIFEIDSSYLKLDFKRDGGSHSIPIKTDLDWDKGFSVTSNKAWCHIKRESIYSRKITISVEQSDELDIREAELVVKSSVANYTINIRQLGTGPNILVKASKIELDNGGDETIVTVTSNVDYTVSQTEGSEWFSEVTSRATKDTEHKWVASENLKYRDRSVELTYTTSHEVIKVAKCSFSQLKGDANSEDIDEVEDVKWIPSRGKASEAQAGAGIENTFDGDDKTVYHSIWSQSAAFPVTLEYFFEDEQPDLDYIIYHSTGGNGMIGNLDIFTATAESPEYTLLGNFNFGMNSSKRKVVLNNLKKATKIKLSVNSGSGNFVTCQELEFFQYNKTNDLHVQLLSVFTDLSCSEVKKDVTLDEIYELPPYFSYLALVLKNNSYDAHEKSFRIRDYEAYSSVDMWSDKLLTRKYSDLDNCTGIHVKTDDEILVLVGETHGRQVTIQSIYESSHDIWADGKPTGQSYDQLGATGDIYFLKEGVNKIKILKSGMLFLMYTADPSDPLSKPIRVHIPLESGIVDGFFDLKEHKTDAKYSELLRKATSKFFFVRGERHMFYFHRETLLKETPNSILSAVNHWDNMVAWQHELMGIDDNVRTKFNNHMLAISTEQAYMWASDYRMGYIYSYLHNILSLEAVQAAEDNAWGPAHEMGHVHQFPINWGGLTEVSNNLFSNYAIYKLGKYPSRGASISWLNTSRFIEDNPFAAISPLVEGNNGDSRPVELTLRIHWQLWNYFHRCGYQKDFWPKMFTEMRKPENRLPSNDPGRAQMNFAKKACEVSNRDLTEFFEMWGFFEVTDLEIGDYGTYQYTVTQEMVDATRAEIKSHNYAPVTAPFYYLDDRINSNLSDVGHYSQFENGGMKITKEVSYTLVGRKVSVTDGEQAVSFEIKKDNELIYFSPFFQFDVHESIPLDGVKLYAVQADGERIEMIKK